MKNVEVFQKYAQVEPYRFVLQSIGELEFDLLVDVFELSGTRHQLDRGITIWMINLDQSVTAVERQTLNRMFELIRKELVFDQASA